jgi:hypothetical protein
VALLAVVLALVVSGLLSALVGLPLGLKVVLTVALIGPLGFVMGMPFPVGCSGWRNGTRRRCAGRGR